MITITKFDWNLGLDVPHKVNEKAVEEFVNFCLNSRAWHEGEEGLELMHKRVRRLRRDAYAEPKTKRVSV